MKNRKLSLPRVKLDIDGFHRNIRREGTPDRVYYFEHGVADNIQEALNDRYDIWKGINPGSKTANWDRAIAMHRFIGHEYFRVFPKGARVIAPRITGEWSYEGKGTISDWKEFEAFPWPDPDNADLSVLDYYEKVLPPDMRVFHVIDLWEVVRDMMGFETICFAIYENPDLVKAMFDKVGIFLEIVLGKCLQYKCYGATYLSDDLGYKTSLMISPEHIHQFIMPWHRRLADLTHSHGKLFFFHSCGQIYDIIDEYIDNIKIDAKHSFEENILPVEEVKQRYGKRMTLLGGIDVDMLARSESDSIRRKVLQVLEKCQHGGGYFLGGGNWITNYIPVDNYLAMLMAGREFSSL